MYKQGDMRTDDNDRLWYLGVGNEWFIMKDPDGTDQFNNVIKKFEYGVPNKVRQYYTTPPQPIGSTQLGAIKRQLETVIDRLDIIERRIDQLCEQTADQ